MAPLDDIYLPICHFEAGTLGLGSLDSSIAVPIPRLAMSERSR